MSRKYSKIAFLLRKSNMLTDWCRSELRRSLTIKPVVLNNRPHGTLVAALSIRWLYIAALFIRWLCV